MRIQARHSGPFLCRAVQRRDAEIGQSFGMQVNKRPEVFRYRGDIEIPEEWERHVDLERLIVGPDSVSYVYWPRSSPRGVAMKEFIVATDEMFRVFRTVRANNHREAAIKALNGSSAGEERTFEQEGIGYVEGVPVAVTAEDETEAQEFDLDEILNGECPEDADGNAAGSYPRDSPSRRS